jgi:hypothetical protein
MQVAHGKTPTCLYDIQEKRGVRVKIEAELSAGPTLMLGPEEQNVMSNTPSTGQERLIKLNILTKTMVVFKMAI